MRIPQYEQQVNTPNAPQFNQIADVRNDNLAVVADAIDKVYQVKLKEQEEAQKTAFFQADNSIKMGLYKAKAELMDKIKNGGSYANAEAEYQKAHDAIIAQFGSAFDADKSGNTKIRAMSEYQADGLQNLMSIRDSVTSRRKSDTAASANLRSEQLGQQLAMSKTPEEADAIRKQMTSNYARATSAMGDNPAEGKLRAMKAIQGAEAQRLKLYMQNAALTGQSSLPEIENRYKENLIDTETYISYRGLAIKQDKINPIEMSAEQTKNFIETAKRAARGELSPEDYADKDNPIIKAEMNSYTPYDSSEVMSVKLDLESRLLALDGLSAKKSSTGEYKVPEWAKTNEGVTKTVAEIRKFQDDVIEAKARGAFTGRSQGTYLTMIKKTNQILGSMKLAVEEPESTWSEKLKFGVQQPEIYVSELSNNLTKDIPLQGIRDWETKTEFYDSLMDKLAGWESSGDRDEDEAKINMAAKTVVRQMVEDGFPHLRGSTLLKEADRVVGDGIDIKITPDRQIKVKDIDAELKAIDEELKMLGNK